MAWSVPPWPHGQRHGKSGPVQLSISCRCSSVSSRSMALRKASCSPGVSLSRTRASGLAAPSSQWPIRVAWSGTIWTIVRRRSAGSGRRSTRPARSRSASTPLTVGRVRSSREASSPTVSGPPRICSSAATCRGLSAEGTGGGAARSCQRRIPLVASGQLVNLRPGLRIPGRAVTFPDRSGRTVAFVRHSRGHRVGVAAWSLAGFTMIVLAAALISLGLDTSKMATNKIAVYGIAALAVIAYAGTGRLIASHVPGNAIGWLLGLIGLSLAATLLTEQYALRGLAVAPGSLPAARVVGWISEVAFIFTFAPMLFLVLLFPD